MKYELHAKRENGEYSAWFFAVGHKITVHGDSFRACEEKADNIMSQLACRVYEASRNLVKEDAA